MTAGRDRYRVVRYEPGLRTAVCRLQQLHWDPDFATNSEYFAWKYERNPYLTEPHLYLAMLDGEVIGMRGVYGARWEAGEPARTFDGPCAGDLVISPEHRGRGLFTRIMAGALADLARENVAWLFNLSAGAATRLGSLGMRWRATAPIERMVRWTEAGPAGAAAPGASRHWLHRAARGLDGLRTGIRLSETARPGAMADLVEGTDRDRRIRHVRDAEYFEWRFGNPLSTYRFVFLGRRRLDAYIVLRSARRPADGWTHVIADWAGESPDARRRVLAAALQYADRVQVWSGPLDESDRLALRAGGLLVRPIHSFADYFPCVLVRPVAAEPPPRPWRQEGMDLLDAASWDVRLLDSDGT